MTNIEKCLVLAKKLLNENDLDFTWYINRCNGVTGYLHNGKVPKLIVAVHLTEEVIKMCSPRMIANDLQYQYGCELLKEFKINMEVE